MAFVHPSQGCQEWSVSGREDEGVTRKSRYLERLVGVVSPATVPVNDSRARVLAAPLVRPDVKQSNAIKRLLERHLRNLAPMWQIRTLHHISGCKACSQGNAMNGKRERLRLDGGAVLWVKLQLRNLNGLSQRSLRQCSLHHMHACSVQVCMLWKN